ncbi:MAG: bifunctional phosphoglucose/phosphomannose isomerase [Bacteroidetes bacterium]|nr:bifunctional phosphoglucose/phosphomannose isomerase [Bacteroidota bacterium]
MTLDEIRSLDPKGMYTWILEFPQQIEEAVRIGKSVKIKLSSRGIQNIVLTGLGGSAIAGDLLRCYLADELSVPLVVNRHYHLPDFVGPKTLVIVSSYSGNTEETVSAHIDATKRKAKVLCISTGGRTEQLALKYKQPWIKIPGGLSPRAALGYSFFPLLVVLARLGIIRSKEKEIRETIQLLKGKSNLYGDPEAKENAPFEVAKACFGKFPVIYSPTEYLEAVNLRWRGQIAENSKQLSHGYILPEMNHNELVGWKCLPDLMKQMTVVFLKDKGTHPRVAIRERITKEIVAQYAGNVLEVESEGNSLLARIFSLVYFGDWVSFYLAILNKVDPEPVEVINFLKSELAKV